MLCSQKGEKLRSWNSFALAFPAEYNVIVFYFSLLSLRVVNTFVRWTMQVSSLDRVTVTFQLSVPSSLRQWRWGIAADKVIPRDFVRTKATVCTHASCRLSAAGPTLGNVSHTIKSLSPSSVHSLCVNPQLIAFTFCIKVQFFNSQQAAPRDNNTAQNIIIYGATPERKSEKKQRG